MRHPAYHLRTNKAVDRLLLVDVVRKLDPEGHDFTYCSFGGPFLEDLRVMDHFFPEMTLISLEDDEETFKRQKFNKFSSRVELKDKSLSEFLLDGHNPTSKEVFWLDYTSLRYELFEGFQNVLTSVLPGSVVRITLRAEPEIDLSSLKGKLSSVEIENLQKELERDIRKRFDKLLPPTLKEGTVTNWKEYARMVQLMVRSASSLALDTAGSTVEFVPVQSTRYNDGTQMLSVTGIVSNREDSKALQEKLKNVRFANLNWDYPDLLNIPSLSMKERFHLEPHLPVSDGEDAGKILNDALTYLIDRNEILSKNQLAHYAQCQRDYPNFVRTYN